MSLFRFFTKQSSDDPLKIINLLDEDKPISKRYNFMISYITKLIKPDEKFSFRLYDFFKEHGETVEQLCITHICLLDSKFRIKSWEEVNNSFSILQELSRYGQCKKIESVQNISKALLQDGNRIELKKVGLNLIMNIISHNENLKVPFDIFVSSVDLSLFEMDSSAQLANREILSKQDFKWLFAIKDLAKGLAAYPFNEIIKISKITANYEMIKESVILFKWILEHTLDGSVSDSGISSFVHFRKWFNILKRSYFLYLYPDLVEENYGRGFEKCPDILHYIIIIWVKKFITIEEINSMLFLNEPDRTFILKILQKSFLWLTPDSEISVKSAISTYKILRNWLNYINYPTLKEISKEAFSIMCLRQISYVFKRKNYQFAQLTEICLRSLELFKIFNQNFKDNPKFFSLLLEICQEIDSGKENEKLLENFSLFLLKTLGTINLMKIQNLAEFEVYLHKWCSKFVIIFQIWKKCLLAMIDSSKSFENLTQTSMFLPLFKIIGSGIEFESESQASWASAVHELILNMLEKKFSPFEILKHFFHDLSKVILQGARDSSTISLHTICQVFTKNTQESPSQLQTRHFFYLIAESVNKPHLVEMVLRHSSIILDYKGMHSLIFKLLTFACDNQNEGLQAVFRVLALPNYYQLTPLLRVNESKSNYLSLKAKIFDFFSNDSFKVTPASFIDGLAIFLIEEIAHKSTEYVENGVNLLLKYCQSPDPCISSTALQNISLIGPFTSGLQMKILDFLVSQVMKPKKIDNENLVISIFYTVLRIFMNREEPIDEGILKLFFQRIAKFGVLANESSKLRAFLSSMVSYLGFYYSNFPLAGTTVEVCDSGAEASVDNTQENFILNKNMVLTVFKDKFIIRNEFGKFLWTCKHFSIFNSELFTDDKNELKKILAMSQITHSNSSHSEMLKNSPTVEFLINWIHRTYEQQEQTTFEPPEDLEAPYSTTKVPKSERKQTSFIEKDEKIESLGKIFISNLGLDPQLTRLENNEKLERSLNLLDTVKSREHVKIGIVYVKPGQDNEKEILANSSCSLEFQEFLRKIGKPVALEDFSCYLGSLDPKGSCGKTSLAYVDWEYELMFHVPVMMPTDPNDPQQVAKKRHVGNDNINIVWSENSREYRIDTIVTHFIFVNIVIYPIEPQLFKIAVHNKLNLNFGPLRDGMVVTWKTLPHLVRTTALNADKAVRIFKFPHFERQTAIRLKKIIDIYEENITEKLRKAKTII